MGRIELPTSPLPRECSTTELHGHLLPSNRFNLNMKHGAGEGNRTLVLSLEGFGSTIELHPQNDQPARHRTFYQSTATLRTNNLWWREKDSNLRRQSRQIYSLFPLTAWVSLPPRIAYSYTRSRICQLLILIKTSLPLNSVSKYSEQTFQRLPDIHHSVEQNPQDIFTERNIIDPIR